MFVANAKGGYDRRGRQWSSGDFLIVLADRNSERVEVGGECCARCGTSREASSFGACNWHPDYAEYVNAYIREHGDLPPGYDSRDPSPVLPDARERWPHDWCPKTAPALWACVRRVRMVQCGHFMMTSARVGDVEVTLSGAYGSDGLPRGLTDALRPHCVRLPDALAREFWSGGGHNSAGAEADAMRAWARANLSALRGRKGKRGVA